MDPEAVEVNWDYGEDAHKGTDPGGQERGNVKLNQETDAVELDPETVEVNWNNGEDAHKGTGP